MSHVPLPLNLKSISHEFEIAGTEGCVTLGFYPDGAPARLVLNLSKSGSELAGFAYAFSEIFSLSLQYGVKIESYIDKFDGVIFEPNGLTKNDEIRFAKSIMDYLSKWLRSQLGDNPPVISGLDPQRRRLPSYERRGVTQRLEIGGYHKCFFTVSCYEDTGLPGELFIVFAKAGATGSGLADALAVSISMALQHGVPVREIAKKLIGVRFEPMGITKHPEIRKVTSIVDFLGRWLDYKFNLGILNRDGEIIIEPEPEQLELEQVG